jgi:hypothetical protein
MTLFEWCVASGAGAATRLARDTGLHYTTVIAAMYGKPLGRRAAVKVHEVTGVPLDALIVGDPENQSGRKKTSRHADHVVRTRRQTEPPRALPDADTIPPTPHEAAS